MNRRRPLIKSELDISPALGFRSPPASRDRTAVERDKATSAKIAIPKSIDTKKNHLHSVAIFRAAIPMADLSSGRRLVALAIMLGCHVATVAFALEDIQRRRYDGMRIVSAPSYCDQPRSSRRDRAVLPPAASQPSNTRGEVYV